MMRVITDMEVSSPLVSKLHALLGSSQAAAQRWASLFKAVNFARKPQFMTPQCSNQLHHRSTVSINHLPAEILVDIFIYLEWKDVFAIRKTCRWLHEVSTARPLWVAMYHKLSEQLEVPLRLESPIELYSAADLERILVTRLAADHCWGSERAPNVRAIPMDAVMRDCDRTVLVEGGRWLLATAPQHANGQILLYDLEKSFPQEPLCLIDIGPCAMSQRWWMLVDVDHSAPTLAFNLCLIPESNTSLRSKSADDGDAREAALPQIHFYRVQLEGHAAQATLRAEWIKSLDSRLRCTSAQVAFRGEYFARTLESESSHFVYLEVCNWVQSEQGAHSKVQIMFQRRSVPDHLLFLPDNRFVTAHADKVAVYNIDKLHPMADNVLENEVTMKPYWSTIPRCFYFGRGPVYSSIPYSTATETKVAIGTIHGIYHLTVPRQDSDISPSWEQASGLNLFFTPWVFIGARKIYAQRADGLVVLSDHASPAPTPASATAPVQREASAGKVVAARDIEPRQWNLGHEWTALPAFDERSGRVFAQAKEAWAVVDFVRR